MHHIERDVLADQPAQQDGQIGHRLAEIEHLRTHGLLARECQQLPHQARRPVGILLDLHDVLERRVGRLVGIQQEIGRHHDGAQQIVEVVRDRAGEPADRLHLLLLVDLVLQRALLGGFDRIDDGGLVYRARPDPPPPSRKTARTLAAERGIDRIDLALASGPRDGSRFPAQGGPVRPRPRGSSGPQGRRLGFAHRIEQAGEQRVRPRDPAIAVDRGDRHRRIVEEAHEAHFGGTLRIAVVAGTIDDQRARRSRRAVGAECHLMEQPCRNSAPGAGLEIDVEDFGAHFAGRRRPGW